MFNFFLTNPVLVSASSDHILPRKMSKPVLAPTPVLLAITLNRTFSFYAHVSNTSWYKGKFNCTILIYFITSNCYSEIHLGQKCLVWVACS